VAGKVGGGGDAVLLLLLLLLLHLLLLLLLGERRLFPCRGGFLSGTNHETHARHSHLSRLLKEE
jgi:hypothetical protein